MATRPQSLATELHLGREPDILVPDLGGWRGERYAGVALEPFDAMPIPPSAIWGKRQARARG